MVEIEGKITLVCMQGEARSKGLANEFNNLGFNEVKFMPGGRGALMAAIRQGMIGEYIADGERVIILEDEMDNQSELKDLEAILDEKGIKHERASTKVLFEKIREIYQQRKSK